VKSEECRVRSESTVRRPEFKVQSSKFKVQSLEKVQGSQSSPESVRGAARSPRSTPERVRGAVRQKFFQVAAFTLIELLIVIGIIVLLAGMLFTALPAIQRVKTTSRLKNELTQIQTAIDTYKAKKGYYPPDNPVTGVAVKDYSVNQLYYELLGTRRTNEGGGTFFYTLDGTAKIQDTQLQSPPPSAFGPNVTGFMNCTRGSGDDTARAENFLKGGLRAGQSGNNGVITVLGSGVDGKFMIGKANPWRYNSSSPTNNPGTYDLWIDYDFGGKSNRICNWSDRAIQLQP